MQPEMSLKNKTARQSQQFRGRRVLLADGSMMNTVHIESLLKHWNLEMDVVRNGKDVIKKVKDFRYDILLIDILLPEINGLDAALQIRTLGHSSEELTIVALSTHSISMDILSRNGIDDIIFKPFLVEDFERKFIKYIDFS
jgi:CheY-like chemotaxis protein